MKKTLLSLVLSLTLCIEASASQALFDARLGNYELAKDKLQSLAAKKNVEAMYALGKMKLFGYGVNKQTAGGMSDIKESAKAGYVPAQLFLAKYFFSIDKKPKEAVEWFSLAAKKGNADAQTFMASAYLHGFGVKKSLAKARHHLIQLARQGNVEAQFILGEQFINERSRRSVKNGLNWLKKSAKGNSVAAQVLLAKLYTTGNRAMQRDLRQASRWLERAEKQDTPYAAYLIGNYYYTASSATERLTALPWYKQAAKKGNIEAQLQLAKVYSSNKLGVQSAKKALYWLEQAATHGSVEAQLRLAKHYATGQGVAKNEKLANQWAAKAQLQQQNVAYTKMLQWLQSVNKGKDSAARYTLLGHINQWSEKAVRQNGVSNASPKMVTLTRKTIFKPALTLSAPGELSALNVIESVLPMNPPKRGQFDFHQYPLANLNMQDKDIKDIYSKALLGNAKAQLEMGKLYEYGVGVKQNTQLAMVWYYEAAKQDNLKAEYSLANLLLNGKGIKPDFKKALYWLNRSAFKGNTHAQYALGLIYEHGYGQSGTDLYIEKDADYADSMLHLAASDNYAPAKLRLADLAASRLTTSPVSVAKKRAQHQRVATLYEQAALQGLSSAQLPLAYYYALTTKDPKKFAWAFNAASRALRQGNEKAALLLGLMYSRGLGVDKDASKGAQFYQRAAKRNEPAALYLLADNYYRGQGVTKNAQKAIELWQQAAQRGFAEADYNLAVVAMRQGNDPAPYLLKAAAADNQKAALYIADSQLAQSSDATAGAKAAAIYKKLAQQGVANAQLKLAYLYEMGQGVDKNIAKAGHWYLLAARNGSEEAQYQIARLYQAGQLKKTQPKKALYWYKRAVKARFVPAMNALGFLYETEHQDYAAAAKWYQQAAKQSLAEAQFNLGLAYDYGKINGTKQQAANFYKPAAEQGVLDAQRLLGEKYFKQVQSDKAQVSARHWFTLAADNGSPQAAYQLANLLESGAGGRVELMQAKQRYQQAAALGYPQAVVALARIHHLSSGAEGVSEPALSFYQQAATNGHVAAQYRVAMYYLAHPSADNNKGRAKGKTLLLAAAKQGYQPAQLALSQMSMQARGSGDVFSYVAPIRFNRPIAMHDALPGQLYISAMEAFDNGQMQAAKNVLMTIKQRFPDYQPAKKALQSLSRLKNKKMSLAFHSKQQ